MFKTQLHDSVPFSGQLLIHSFSLSAQIGSLQMKILSEDKAVEQKTTEMLQEWEKSKPVQVQYCGVEEEPRP